MQAAIQGLREKKGNHYALLHIQFRGFLKSLCREAGH